MKLPRLKSFPSWLLVITVAAALLGGGYFFVQTRVRPWAKEQLVKRYNRSATDFLVKDDPLNALLLARRSLQRSRDNPDAWRAAAAAAKKLDRPEATYYQDSLARLAPTRENYLELIRLCVHFGQDIDAMDAIKRAASLAARDPEYYRLAARVYLRQGRPLAAKYFLIDLTTLQPDDATARLDLAQIEITEDPARKDLAVRARVRSLAAVPELRARALAVLLTDTVQAKLGPESKELAAQLAALPELTLEDRLLLIQANLLTQPDRARSLLSQLQTEIASQPDAIARVIDFMGATGADRDVAAWAESLARETRMSDPVRRALAESYLRLRDWEKLRGVTQDGTWQNSEYLRRALLAHSYKAQGRKTEFDEAWKGAVLEAGQNLRSAIDLLTRVDGWRWQRERHDVLWKLFSLVPENQQVREQLLVWERAQGNTTNLNRLFARMVELDASDKVAQNNFAYASLLLDANIAKAALMARDLARAEPDNPYYASTFALALFKEGKAPEALAQLGNLRVSALAQPERMMLQALFLSRAGQFERAEEILLKLDRRGLLPEERRLAEASELELVRNHRAQSNLSRLIALRQSQPAARDEGWLGAVKPETRALATVDMQLSDNVYASGDRKALLELLRTTQWGGSDHLRHTLIAYCRRSENPAAARETWSRALGSVQRDSAALEDLQSLVTRWQWPVERIEVVNQLHLNAPSSPERVAELTEYYRGRKRTLDLIRVLRPWIEASPGASEALAYYYYALLANVETSQSVVAAKTAFEANPANLEWQVIYAFSLWRQQRSPEAQMILRQVDAKDSKLIPIALVKAVVDAELGRMDSAQKHLALFDPENALPEEVELAKKTNSRLAQRD